MGKFWLVCHFMGKSVICIRTLFVGFSMKKHKGGADGNECA